MNENKRKSKRKRQTYFVIWEKKKQTRKKRERERLVNTKVYCKINEEVFFAVVEFLLLVFNVVDDLNALIE